MSNRIKTKWGYASLTNNGYRINDNKSKFNSKLVHRLLFEEHYGKLSSKDKIIHIDGDKTNNDISNLKLIKSKAIPTEFGNASFYGGYYSINSSKQLLHRAIWEKFHGPIPEGYNVHHIDGNKLNNDISNLELIHHNKHAQLHGQNMSDETKSKMSKSKTGKGNPKFKDYPRIVKAGFDKGKQVWKIVFNAKVVCRSNDYSKLEKKLAELKKELYAD